MKYRGRLDVARPLRHTGRILILFGVFWGTAKKQDHYIDDQDNGKESCHALPHEFE